MIQIFRKLRSIHPISEDLRTYLEDNLKKEKIRRKGFLLQPGETCMNVYYVETGLLRCYYEKGDREISSGFSIEGELCVEMEGFFTQTASQSYIQAVEDSVLYYLSYAQVQHVYKEFIEAHSIGRTLLEIRHVKYLQRSKALWMQNAEDRVKWLLDAFPEMIQRVPARYLASYIGITEGFLSKIKSEL